MDYDVMVVGSGIGGMESALKLGDMGYRVLLVEKEPTVGGKMILLSKVFPTLDCASCISTPKMAAATHHPNVTVMVDSNVQQIERDGDGGFRVMIERRPRFVDEAACTGCRLCEQACTVSVPDQYNGDLIPRRAAYIPFPQAVPQKALLERAGTSPCTFECPAGIKAHGYVSLIRSGEYEKAFELVLETTPLAGTLGRACYAPCEEACTRGELEGPLPIRRLKRFVADRHYSDSQPGAPETAAASGPPPSGSPASGKRVAIVGSGPAGLTAAWQLARRGHAVRILEAAPEPGGALRLAIPSYRLPAEVVERDIENVRSIGVEIATNTRVEDLDGLLRDGFDAVLVATGTPVPIGLRVPGEELDGVASALRFLREIKLDAAPDLAGRTVVVIGGGNVAIDTARSARRLGAAAVHLVCLEAREQMPAHEFEVTDAIAEGIEVHPRWGIVGFAGDSRVEAIKLKRCTAVFDESGAFRPQYDESISEEIACDSAFVAVGMAADTAAFPALVPDGARWLAADRETCETALAGVFAAGDAVTGPANITEAVGHGRRAAYMIDRYLQGLALDGFEQPLPVIERDDVLARQQSYAHREPLAAAARMSNSPSDFSEIEAGLEEAQARAAAGRCLDCGVCSECHECVAACPPDAIHLDQRAHEEEYEVGAVIVSTGYTLFAADAKPEYGWGRYRNVITGTQMERLLAPTRPYNTVLRPSDGRVPERIAYVMCTGSRDKTVGNPLCSKFCCMYSIKQNQLIMGALPLADVTVHYIDIRAVGKGYDEFFEQAKAMGANFLKGRVAGIVEKEDGNLIVRYEDMENGGSVAEAEYDLVVLAVGVLPNADAGRLFGVEELALDAQQFVAESDEDIDPARTNIPGVFVAGAAAGPKDIPESILHAGAAVVQAAAHVDRRKVHA